jgi:DNA-binding IclR family transcriptional regulator
MFDQWTGEGVRVPRTNQPGRSVSERLLDVLFTFRPDRSRLSLAELSRATGMPHATVRRYALELVRAGALERDADGTFTVGIRLWQLGGLAPLSLPLRTIALPFMEDLRAALDEHVQLAVREGVEAVIVERLSTDHAVDVVSQVGGRLPLHCSGVGKVLLAHAGPDAVDQVLRSDLRWFTARTITDPARLREELAACRQSGVAIVREEMSPRADSVATRVMGADGTVVAALSAVVRSGSMDLRQLIPSVIASGLGISRRLGWQPAAGVR